MILYALTHTPTEGGPNNAFYLRMNDAIKDARELASASGGVKVVKLDVEGRDAHVELLNIASGHINSLIAGEVVFPVGKSRKSSTQTNDSINEVL